MTGIAISIDWLHVIPCHSSAYHPARIRLARPHPVLWHYPLEGVPRRGVPDAGIRRAALRCGTHGGA